MTHACVAADCVTVEPTALELLAWVKEHPREVPPARQLCPTCEKRFWHSWRAETDLGEEDR